MIITIARECGCGGDNIAQILARRYSLKTYDKYNIKKLAEQKNVYNKYPDFYNEQGGNTFLSAISEDDGMNIAQKTPALALQNVISDKSFVIIGRCSNFVYKDRADVLRIFISGDHSKRIERTAKKHKVSTRKASIIVDETDERRRSYQLYYTGEKWGYASNYDLCINIDKIGDSGLIKIINQYINIRNLAK